jgi:arylsulfatase A-like enzyme
LTIDSLRADHVGIVRGDVGRNSLTPHIDAWGSEATVFGYAVSQSTHTSPSFLALLSGFYPCKYGDWFSRVSSERIMLAEVLKRAGFSTRAVNSNPYISQTFSFDRGFDVFIDNVKRVRSHGWRRRLDLEILRIGTLLRSPYEAAAKINEQAFGLLEKARAPFFLWVHYMDVHGPYIPEKGWALANRLRAASLWRKALSKPERITETERRLLTEAYRGKVKAVDYQIKRLLDTIDQQNTIIVLAADHGELLGEHGLFGHPLQLHEKLLHVPLLIKVPGGIGHTRRRVDDPVGLLDVVPTVLDLAGLGAPAESDGLSLVPLMKENGDGPRRRHLISEVSRRRLCARRGWWKLIVDLNHDRRFLHDLSRDPGEAEDVADREPAMADELENVIQEHVERNREVGAGAAKFEAGDEVKAQLRALGYFD